MVLTRGKHIHQRNRIETLEINLYIFGQLTFDMDAKVHLFVGGERTVISLDGSGTTEYPQVKE